MRKEDDLYSQVDEPIAVLRKRYFIICQKNCCAALLLDRFYAQLIAWGEEHDYTLVGDKEPTFYYFIRALARDLFWAFDVEEVYHAILYLADKGYIRFEVGDCHSEMPREYRQINISCDVERIIQACKMYDAYIGPRFNRYSTPTTLPVYEDEEDEDEEDEEMETEQGEEEEEEVIYTPPPPKPEISEEERLARRRGEEQRTVISHNKRAKKVGLSGDLTIDQWIDILNYFEWKCAYCQAKPYEVLEHFVPIIHGGGTTDTNCVPACFSCNGKKLNWNPLATYGPLARMREQLDRVQQYLESRTSTTDEASA